MLIPIVFWKTYRETVHGRRLKVVPCENCSTEYVYLLEREGSGAGASLYMLNNEAAAGQAKEGADESLASALENDFDPVPCPACGHYQRFMFAKLRQPRMWLGVARLVVILIGCLLAVSALYNSFSYWQRPDGEGLGRMALTWLALLLVGLLGVGLGLAEAYDARRFNPNLQDQQARIAMGRSRAITRAEFEKTRQENDGG